MDFLFLSQLLNETEFFFWFFLSFFIFFNAIPEWNIKMQQGAETFQFVSNRTVSETKSTIIVFSLLLTVKYSFY